jgi:hypothetical protein
MEGYDLKVFHIKAKSCNWGPMAGFICQLPILNKYGSEKIGFNAEEIGHYLLRLQAFIPVQRAIDAIKLQQGPILDQQIAALTNVQSPTYIADVVARKTEENKLRKAYSDAILAEYEKVRLVARTTRNAWTGENSLEDNLPFIGLQRKFTDLSAVKAMRGVLNAVSIDATSIYGLAQNVTDEDSPNNNKPSVIIEFLLKKTAATDNAPWGIYHGRVFYKNNKNDAAFNQSFISANATQVVTSKMTKYENQAASIASFSNNTLTLNAEAVVTANTILLNNATFANLSADNIFYEVKGIMNPFPPFKKNIQVNNQPQANPNYYKNAVSGDYDLFAIWPDQKFPLDEVKRESEITSSTELRLHGKIFTAWLGSTKRLGIEFIPGFAELNPSEPQNLMKESADFGNMHNLGYEICGYLNNFSYNELNKALLQDPNASLANTALTGNKAFHSDEGGRPVIMEVEYPIAVFFPSQKNQWL